MLGVQAQLQFLGRTAGAAIPASLFYVNKNDLLLGHRLVCGCASFCVFLGIITLRISIRQRDKYKTMQNTENTCEATTNEEVIVI